MTRERFNEIRQEIRRSAPPEAQLAKTLELWEANEGLAWKLELLVEMARAHEACGKFDGFIAGLEKRAAANDLGAALLLAGLRMAMFEPQEALGWVEQAPLGDTEFWSVAKTPLATMACSTRPSSSG